MLFVDTRDGGLEDRPRSRGRPRDLISMASVSVLVSAVHVSVSVLVSEVPTLSTGSREPASVSRPASRPNLDGLGLGLGLGHPCLGLGLGLGSPGLDYNPDPNSLKLLIKKLLSSSLISEAVGFWGFQNFDKEMSFSQGQQLCGSVALSEVSCQQMRHYQICLVLPRLLLGRDCQQHLDRSDIENHCKKGR